MSGWRQMSSEDNSYYGLLDDPNDHPQNHKYSLTGENHGDYYNSQGWWKDEGKRGSVYEEDKQAPTSGTAGKFTMAGALATANPYLMAATAAFQVISGIQDAEILRGNAEIAKQINEMNAQNADIEALKAETFGETQAARYQTQIDQTVGEQRTQMAAQNVDVNFGTAAALQDETRLTGHLNILDLKRQAQEKALGIRQQARSIRMQGSMNSSQAAMAASHAQTQGVVGGAVTVLSGYARK